MVEEESYVFLNYTSSNVVKTASEENDFLETNICSGLRSAGIVPCDRQLVYLIKRLPNLNLTENTYDVQDKSYIDIVVEMLHDVRAAPATSFQY